MEIFRRSTLKHSPSAVWKAISTVEGLPGWLPGVESADYLSGPKEGKGRRQRVRRLLYKHQIEIEQEVEVWEPDKRLVLRHLRETSGGRELRALEDFKTIISIEPRGEGSSVLAEYSWQTRSISAQIMSMLFAGRTMGRELRDLLRKLDGCLRARAGGA